MGIWSNAFKLPEKKQLSELDKAFILKAVEMVKKRNLSHVAALALESTTPVHNLTSQMVVFAMPFLNFVFEKKDVDRLAELLANPLAAEFFKENL